MITRTAIVVLLAVASSGCATIMNGATQKVFFDSEPQGAEIEYDGKILTTPCLITLFKYYKGLKIPIYKSGFAPQEIECRMRPGGWIFGNLLFGGLIGIIVDSATAAHMDYVEENHRVTLVPVDEIAARGFDNARAAAKKDAEEKRKRAREYGDDWPTVYGVQPANSLKDGF